MERFTGMRSLGLNSFRMKFRNEKSGMLGKQYIENEAIMNLKRMLILLLACLAAQTALAEPSLAEKNAAENAAIKKEWESWNAPFKPFRLIGNIHYVASHFSTAVASEARHRFRAHRTG